MNDTIQLNPCPQCGLPIPQEAPQGLCPKCVLHGAATDVESEATAAGDVPSLERMAKAFPQFEILELIGRGGMGFVFKARQPHLDRFVALKLLPENLARDPRFAERFHREGRVLARLNHPNIVSVYDFGQTEAFFFLLMEYVDGVNLRQAMQAGRFSPAEALAIVPKICEALQYAHGQGILHRDIKPANILLDARGQVKIADFGIAKLMGEDKPDVTLTATGAALGTPHYMAPEQLEKPSEVDHRADIYSLGVVFYEMLTGELPLGRFAAPSAKTPVNANVDEVVFRTLEKDRERRYQSAGEMKTQVEHLGAGAPSGPVSTTPARLSRLAVAGAALVGLSLPVPLMIASEMASGRGWVGRGEIWFTLASIALPGLAGTVLGWLGLSRIRESGGRVRGTPVAMFATLTWPLLFLSGFLLAAFSVISHTGGRSGVLGVVGRLLMLSVPAGVVTFGIWMVHATTRWARGEPVAQRRGVLKWIFIVILMAGVGLVSVRRLSPPITPVVAGEPEEMATDGAAVPALFAEDQDAGDAARRKGKVLATDWLTDPVNPNETNAIQFTFTNFELRQDADHLWLSMDYATDVRCDCEEVFATSGFGVATRKNGLLVTPKGSPAVLRQRFEWQIPEEANATTVADLSEALARTLVGKSVLIPAGEQRQLFQLPVGPAAQVLAAIGTMVRTPAP